jgi:hypothetical protein
LDGTHANQNADGLGLCGGYTSYQGYYNRGDIDGLGNVRTILSEGERICVKRNLDLATLYLTDGSPQEWPDTLKNDVRGEDRANLTTGSVEVCLDLLDGGFEFGVIKFYQVRGECEDFSRLSMLPLRPATIEAEKAMYSIPAYW